MFEWAAALLPEAASAATAGLGDDVSFADCDDDVVLLLFDEEAPGARVSVPFRIGTFTFVDRFRISFPCTASLVLDFLSSSVSISTKMMMMNMTRSFN